MVAEHVEAPRHGEGVPVERDAVERVFELPRGRRSLDRVERCADERHAVGDRAQRVEGGIARHDRLERHVPVPVGHDGALRRGRGGVEHPLRRVERLLIGVVPVRTRERGRHEHVHEAALGAAIERALEALCVRVGISAFLFAQAELVVGHAEARTGAVGAAAVGARHAHGRDEEAAVGFGALVSRERRAAVLGHIQHPLVERLADGQGSLGDVPEV
mmetsp:Transcript_12279/g.51711  ORF Transcript_12279/g.51711 Transcript_12279/m.51711 type:complete len:217 (-) Transcript_12279:531-1181(-)